MGSQRRSLFVGLAACLGIGAMLLPRPAWCGGGDDSMHVLAPVYGAPRSSADKVLTLQAEPAFLGCNNSYSVRAVPVAVTVTNRGAARDATLEMEAAPPYEGQRVYRRLIHLAENAVTHVTLGGDFRNYVSNVVVRLETGNSVRAEVTTSVSSYGTSYSSGTEGRMALLSDRIGALKPILTASPTPPNNPDSRTYETCYVKPESAPDHAEGYRSLKVLVAGVGAERLTSAQWQAIRGWVTGGGSLIVLGQKDWSKAAPEFAELSPERVTDPKQTQVIEQVPVTLVAELAAQNGLFRDPYNQKATVVTGALNVDSAPMSSLQQYANQKVYAAPVFARRQVGAGMVLYSGIDFTDHALRTRDVTRMWEILGHRATTSGHWRYNYDNRPDWANNSADRPAAVTADAAHDPFTLALPPLTQVVYVFAAYFMLAVPITFVVLKRTRRMNLAWASGPILAFLFAGVFYLFSFRLYMAPLSRRTTGELYAAAGDKQARFTGYTEMFFPHGGRYDVTIPRADRMEYFSDEGWGDGSVYGLETADDGVTERTPDFGVSNLAFRRLHHSQTVDWGTGVTGEVHSIGTDSNVSFLNATAPKIAGTIVNGTGMTLHHVRVTWKSRSGSVLQANVDMDCPPGRTTLPPTIATSVDYSSDDVNMIAPVLTAQVDGASFGPRLGNDVGGSSTVNVVVSLPLPSDEKGGSR